MSLDVYLIDEAGEELFSGNITHNLHTMAGEAGVYECLWRPEENGITRAQQIIEPLEAGVTLLVTQKARFEEFSPSNGWGTWDDLVLFCADYLKACKEYPNAKVHVSR